MRVRATRGLRISNFYGNHFIRGQDLLALPNCTSDSCFALDFTYDEPNLTATAITVQAALLYTNSMGERRIRVHTMVIPATNSAPDMLNSLDIDCAVNIISKQAIDIAQKTGIETARRRVDENTADIFTKITDRQTFERHPAPRCLDWRRRAAQLGRTVRRWRRRSRRRRSLALRSSSSSTSLAST